ncbi:MAG TPA: hypothetical protein VHB73_01465 [Alphaproteobacteria bacterium]|nr:hypothetical protein [Alphaproteobacteria bacterium]
MLAPAAAITVYQPLSTSGEPPQKALDEFFAAGGLTVYATSTPSWRWRACAGHSLEAIVIDPHSVIESAAASFMPAANQPAHKRKPFEHHTLVRWLTRAANTTRPAETAPGPSPFGSKDAEAYAGLLGVNHEEWAVLGLKPALMASEIQHFDQGHNAALSDIENAFLPSKLELPLPLAAFYIRHLVQARRDVEAALLTAQSCGSMRIAERMADAVAVHSFEAAAQNPVHYEGNDYAASALRDTSAYIDEAVAFSVRKLAVPTDHPAFLLRLNLKEITEAACDIVESLRPDPYAFLLKAKELYMARCDVNRFPPNQRFLTSLSEGDLQITEEWVQRLALAYERIFESPIAAHNKRADAITAKVVQFKR